MKRFHARVLAGVLSVAGGAAMAASAGGSLSPFPPKYLPVLVQVDRQGKVTDASPAVSLPPAVERMLNQNLSQMITRPAYSHGHPVASQFVINLALQATPREEGDYYAKFVYLSTTPVPSGTWHWVNLNDRRFALAGPDDRRLRYVDGNRSPYTSGGTIYHAPAAPAVSNGTVRPGGQAASRSGVPGH